MRAASLYISVYLARSLSLTLVLIYLGAFCCCSPTRLSLGFRLRLVSTIDHYHPLRLPFLTGRPPGSKRCKALYNYVAREPDELTIAKEDVILILYKQPNGWWRGDLAGRVGVFPANYVQEL